MFAVYLPFIYKQLAQGDIFFVVKNLFVASGHFSLFSVNAFNTYTAVGLNYLIYPGFFAYINYAVIALIVIWSVLFFLKKPTDENAVLMCVFIIVAVFMLSVSMHERYLTPAVAGPILVAMYAINTKPLKIAGWGFYILHSVNLIWYVILSGMQKYDTSLTMGIPAIIFSLVTIAFFCLFVFEVTQYVFKKERGGLNTIKPDSRPR
jgi:Gpi18-like mannosyltransferase